MADKKELDDELDEELDLGAEKNRGPIIKIITIVLAVFLILGINTGVTWWLVSSDDKKVESTKKGADQEEVDAEEEADAEEEDAEEEEAAEEEEVLPALYYALEPSFVVNLPPGSKARMLQVSVQLMTRDPKLLEFIKNNDPMLRHSLLTIFSAQNADNLRTREGKEKLREEVMAEVVNIIAEQGGPGDLEAVFFTGMVMQ